MLRMLHNHCYKQYLAFNNRLMFAKTEFKPTPERFSFPDEETNIMHFWKEHDCFKKQLQITKDMPPFTFYDGPPFATGEPHYGHIAAGTIKDVVCRYASQTGHHVTRRFGWDCHGLPVQYEIDKKLKIKDKKQIMEMGIKQYNQECRNIVMHYSEKWEHVINRYGRWIDFKNDYKTMDLNFMESVWYVFNQLFQKNLVYRGRKIMPYSNGCTTVLSNFQVQLNYKEVDDPSLWVNFPMAKDPQTKFMVWTTTPWTLPSNLALAVNPTFDYVKLKDVKRNQVFIMAECRVKEFYGKDKKAYEILEKMKGTELEGIEYVPMFDYFLDRAKDGCFRVQCADFVTSDAGTGIVHCAPGFGEEDYKMCVNKKIINPDNPIVPLDESGKFTKEIPDYENVYVKDADKMIIKDLDKKGRVVLCKWEKHSYPFCWRSETPLIYKAVASWFIKVTDIKQNLITNNYKATWVPKSIQQNKFNNWLKDARDWCFSRNRYWGNPIPLWVSEDGEEVVCIGSVKELEELTGEKITDLHRESIDHLTIESKQGKGKLRRVEQVFDCWFESGSMPFAQLHYPFDISEEQFSKVYPADFIGEGIDQTRGWFYTLNVISTGVKNLNPYKNLIVNGHVLAEDGKKMSKRLKNYPDPLQVTNEFGADSVRMYLIDSPLVKADNLCFSKKGLRTVIKDVFLPWYNAYRFLIQNLSKHEQKHNQPFQFRENVLELSKEFNVTDRWIESTLQTLVKNVRKEMSDYKLYNVVPELVKFLDLLTNWYVRLNRPRIKGEQGEEQWLTSLNVLFDVLLKINILLSPVVPFLTEHMYQNMKLVLGKDSQFLQDSIHHLRIPEVEQKLVNVAIEYSMTNAMSIIETARKLREKKKISLKQPIMSLTVVHYSQQLFDDLKDFIPYIEEEVNVATIKNETKTENYMSLEALPNLPVFAPKFKTNKQFGDIKKAITKLTTQEIQKCKDDGKIEVLGNELVKEDLLIKEKHKADNVQEYEIIGGQNIIVVLDSRQNEQLKIKGFSREIINRIQKLKKKAHLKVEDQVLIFYHFSKNSKYLSLAFEKQNVSIRKAVKKTMLPLESYHGLSYLAKDIGTVDEQAYEIVIAPLGPIFNHTLIQNDFDAKTSRTLIQCMLTMPYHKLSKEAQIAINLDGKEYVLINGKHYKCQQ